MDLRFSRAAVKFLMAVFLMTIPGVSSAHDMAYYNPPPMFEEAVAQAAAPVITAPALPSRETLQIILGAPYAAAPKIEASVRPAPLSIPPPIPSSRPSHFKVSPEYARMLREGKTPTYRNNPPQKVTPYKEGDALALKPMTVHDILESLE